MKSRKTITWTISSFHIRFFHKLIYRRRCKGAWERSVSSNFCDLLYLTAGLSSNATDRPLILINIVFNFGV